MTAPGNLSSVLVGDVTLASEVGELIAKVCKITAAPWSVNRFDESSGLCSYQLQAAHREGDGLVVATCDEHDCDPAKLAQARVNAHGIAALRNQAHLLLNRAMVEIDRLRVELHARGGR